MLTRSTAAIFGQMYVMAMYMEANTYLAPSATFFKHLEINSQKDLGVIAKTERVTAAARRQNELGPIPGKDESGPGGS